MMEKEYMAELTTFVDDVDEFPPNKLNDHRCVQPFIFLSSGLFTLSHHSVSFEWHTIAVFEHFDQET